jgi:CSLREA domain-containing protein
MAVAALVLGPMPAPTVQAATITVNSLADTQAVDMACTLREAIINANNNDQSGSTDCTAGAGDDTIMFSVTGTIRLGSVLPTIVTTATINGANQITISGDTDGNGTGDVPVFEVNSATLNLQNLTVTKGNRAGDSGGGLFNNLGTVTITNSTFTNNTAEGDAGGLFNNLGTVTITNSTFSDNTADFDGGGLYNNVGTVMITNSTFSNNTADFSGGGLFNNSGTVTITSSTFSDNSSEADGGGLRNTSGTVTITNSTFSDNTAEFAGSGLDTLGGTVAITNSTFSDNSSENEDGCIHNTFNSTTVTLRNTIVANNPGGNCDGMVTDGGGNLSWPDMTCPGINQDPRLGPLQVNAPGTTATHALMIGSAAIDAGDDAICAAAVGAPNFGAGGLDQRGVARPQGVHCDIGAYEAEVGLMRVLLKDERNGNRVCVDLETGAYTFQTGSNQMYTGTVAFTRIGNNLVFRGGANGNRLDGAIELRRRAAKVTLRVGRRVFGIVDLNIDNNGACT